MAAPIGAFTGASLCPGGHSQHARRRSAYGRMAIRCLVALGCCSIGSGSAAGQAATESNSAADRQAFFEERIRPALTQYCHECHSVETERSGGLLLDSREGWQAGGDLGPAVIPGDPAASRLIVAIEYSDPNLQMPPTGQLPPNVIEDFRRWIAAGANDPRATSPAGRAASSRDAPPTDVDDRDGAVARQRALSLAEAQQHWAYRPIDRVTVVAQTRAATQRVDAGPVDRERAGLPDRWGSIDSLITSRLHAAGLAANPLATRAVLVRRLTFDLHGLPPTPDEIQAFCADRRPDAYERLVDRLLSSPRFGERMARHWLDVARYAESLTLRGFILPNAWRYRDYCIAGFASDRPWDVMLREQIAGDLMSSDDLERRQQQLIAVTFLLLGNTNLEEQDKPQLEMDVIDEQLETMGRACLAQTLGCARCHDHKFDPIPTRDYYALAGIFKASTVLQHDNVSKWVERPLPLPADQAAEYERLESELHRLDDEIASGERAASPPDATRAAMVAELKAARQQVREKLAQRPTTMGLLPVAEPADLAVHIRGSVHQLGPVVPRGLLQLAQLDSQTAVASAPSGACDRLALAHWMTDPRHPLTARVMANRVWQWLMGEGVVRTVDNFGTTGEPPDDPMLLDWLALELVDHEWSVQHLVRTIVMSAAYRRSSDTHAIPMAIDPENRYWWRAERRWLEAECIRDALLSMSGELSTQLGGRRVPPSLAADYGYVHTEPCRSIYLPMFRNALPELLEVFNLADPSVSVGYRERSISPQQSLLLMNHPWVIERTTRTAERLKQAGHGVSTRILDAAGPMILGRPLAETERAALAARLEVCDGQVSVESLSRVVQCLFASLDCRVVE